MPSLSLSALPPSRFPFTEFVPISFSNSADKPKSLFHSSHCCNSHPRDRLAALPSRGPPAQTQHVSRGLFAPDPALWQPKACFPLSFHRLSQGYLPLGFWRCPNPDQFPLCPRPPPGMASQPIRYYCPPHNLSTRRRQ